MAGGEMPVTVIVLLATDKSYLTWGDPDRPTSGRRADSQATQHHLPENPVLNRLQRRERARNKSTGASCQYTYFTYNVRVRKTQVSDLPQIAETRPHRRKEMTQQIRKVLQ